MVSQCFQFQYFIVLVGIFILEIAIGAMGFTYRNQVAHYIAQDLTTSGLQKYNATGEQGLTKAWDKMQTYVSQRNHYEKLYKMLLFYTLVTCGR